MGGYHDFQRQHSSDKSRLRRLYWVYGEEEIFRILVVRRIKELAGADPFNTLHLSLSDTPETEVWAALNQHPLDSDHRRLVIVLEAQKLKHEDRVLSWLKDNQSTRSKNVVAVFVSTNHEWDSEVRTSLGKSSVASVVKCSLPKDSDGRLKRSQEAIHAWSHGRIGPYVAGELVRRVNYDMFEAYAVVQKTSLFPDYDISVAAVESLAPHRVEEDIIWSLLALNKRRAAEALVETDLSGHGGNIIGALSTHVEALSRIHSTLTTVKSPREAAARLHEREQYVRMLFPYARLYPRKEAVRRTLLLSRLDTAWQAGARVGVLESLVSLW